MDNIEECQGFSTEVFHRVKRKINMIEENRRSRRRRL